MKMDWPLLKNRQLQACGRCIGGRIMGEGDDASCVNCGWRPETAEPLARAMADAPERRQKRDKRAA